MKCFCSEINLPAPSQCETYDKFRFLDKNKDGKLSLEEFSVFIKEILEKDASTSNTSNTSNTSD